MNRHPYSGLTRYEGQVPLPVAVYAMTVAGLDPSALGLTPLGYRRDGSPIWPMAGGDDTPLHEQDLNAFRTVEELTAHRTALSQRLSAIVADAGGKPLSDEAKAEFAAIKDLIEGAKGVDERLAEQEFLLETVARLGADAAHTEAAEDRAPASYRRPGQPSRTSTARRPDAPRRVPDNPFDLGAYHKLGLSMEAEQALKVDGAKFALDDMSFYNPDVAQDAVREHVHELFDSNQDGPGAIADHILYFGSEDYLRGYVFSMAGKPLDPAAAHAVQLASGHAMAMELATGSQGGFVVPDQLDPTLLPTTDGVINSLRKVARVEKITGAVYRFVTSGGVSVRRGLEGTTMQVSEPVLGRPEIATVQVDGFVPFSFALGIAWQGILPALAREMADAKDIEEAGSFIYGDGTDEEPGGLLGTLPDSSRITTGALGTSDLYGITGKHENRLPPRFRPNASWLGDTGVYNEIRALADDSDGSALWVRLGEGLPDGLLGKPNYEQSTMPFSSEGGDETNDDYLVYADFKAGFVIVDRLGMVTEVAQHLFNQAVAGTGFGVPTGQRGFIAHWHNNARILVPNAIRVLTRKEIGSGS